MAAASVFGNRATPVPDLPEIVSPRVDNVISETKAPAGGGELAHARPCVGQRDGTGGDRRQFNKRIVKEFAPTGRSFVNSRIDRHKIPKRVGKPTVWTDNPCGHPPPPPPSPNGCVSHNVMSAIPPSSPNSCKRVVRSSGSKHGQVGGAAAAATCCEQELPVKLDFYRLNSIIVRGAV